MFWKMVGSGVTVSSLQVKTRSFKIHSECFPSGVCSPPDLPDSGEVLGHCLPLQQSAPRQTSDWGELLS